MATTRTIVTFVGILLLGHRLPAPAGPRQIPTHATSTTSGGAATPSTSVLLVYQMALDDVAAGRLAQARSVLEEGIAINGNQPELNLLLAYVLQRLALPEQARAQLAPMRTSSAVAAEFYRQLGEAAKVSRVPVVVKHSEQPVFSLPDAVVPAAQINPTILGWEHLLAELVNDERSRSGLSVLTYDETLAAAARGHSFEMRDRSYFAHESPTPSIREPLARYLTAFKVPPLIVAENIYRSWGSRHQLVRSDLDAAQQAFLNSPGHRANIMHPRITRIGVGIVTNTNGDMWVTQMFSRP